MSRFSRRAGAAASSVVAVAGLSLLPAVTAAAATNLLPNGSFDSGSISGWKAGGASLSLASPGYGGTAGAIKVAHSGTGTSYTLYASPRPATNVTAGTAVVGDGYVLGVSGKNICLLLQEHNSSGSAVQTVHLCEKGTGAWQALPTVTLIPQASGDSVGYMIRQYGATSGDSFLADSLSLSDGAAATTSPSPSPTTTTSSPSPSPTPTTASGASLLPNGTFDGGSTTGWKAVNAKLSLVSPGEGGSGDAAKVTRSTGTIYSMFAYPRPATGLVAGTALQGTADVLGVKGRTLCLLLQEYKPGGGLLRNVKGCATATGSWQTLPTVSLTVKTTNDSVGYRIQQGAAVAGDSFQADNLSLIEGATPTPTPTPTPTTAGTAGHWPLDETSGTTVHDISGNGNNGSISGPVTIGVPGYTSGTTAYSFPGTKSPQGYVSVPWSKTLTAGAANIDISFWLNTTHHDSNLKADYDLVRMGDYPYQEYKVELEPNGQLNCTYHGSNGGAHVQAGPDLSDGHWHYIQCIKTSSQIQLWIDGKEETPANHVVRSVNPPSGTPLVMGAHPGSDWYWGELDNVTLSFG